MRCIVNLVQQSRLTNWNNHSNSQIEWMQCERKFVNKTYVCVYFFFLFSSWNIKLNYLRLDTTRAQTSIWLHVFLSPFKPDVDRICSNLAPKHTQVQWTWENKQIVHLEKSSDPKPSTTYTCVCGGDATSVKVVYFVDWEENPWEKEKSNRSGQHKNFSCIQPTMSIAFQSIELTELKLLVCCRHHLSIRVLPSFCRI